jgi:hypothetical protein
VADFGGQTQMVVKMVVRPIAKLSEGTRYHERLLLELRCSDEWLPTILGSNLAAHVCRHACLDAVLG